MGEGRARGMVALAASRGVSVLSGAVLLLTTGVVLQGPSWLVMLGRGRLVPHYLASAAALLVTCVSAALLTPAVRAVLALRGVERPCDRVRVEGVVHLTNVVHLACLTAAVVALAWTPATLALRIDLQDMYTFHLQEYSSSDTSRLLLDGMHRGMGCCGMLRNKAMDKVPWSCCDTSRTLCRASSHGGLHPDDAFVAACDSVIVRRLHVVHAVLDASAVLAAALALLHRLLLLHFFSSVRTVRATRTRLHRAEYPMFGLIFR